MLGKLRLRRSDSLLGVIILAVAFATFGCSVKLSSDYDETTDRTVSALQRKTEAHFIALESSEGSPECKYERRKQFYDEAKVEVSAISVRAASIPKNEVTTQESVLLSNSLASLEKLHKIACLTRDQIMPLRIEFNSIFTAILKLELAKRRSD